LLSVVLPLSEPVVTLATSVITSVPVYDDRETGGLKVMLPVTVPFTEPVKGKVLAAPASPVVARAIPVGSATAAAAASPMFRSFMDPPPTHSLRAEGTDRRRRLLQPILPDSGPGPNEVIAFEAEDPFDGKPERSAPLTLPWLTVRV
jgi:hypothetical protein